MGQVVGCHFFSKYVSWNLSRLLKGIAVLEPYSEGRELQITNAFEFSWRPCTISAGTGNSDVIRNVAWCMLKAFKLSKSSQQ